MMKGGHIIHDTYVFFYSYMYGLFTNAVSTSDYTASPDCGLMNIELERMWNQVVMAYKAFAWNYGGKP
jgi:hypothetical protein